MSANGGKKHSGNSYAIICVVVPARCSEFLFSAVANYHLIGSTQIVFLLFALLIFLFISSVIIYYQVLWLRIPL